MTTCVHCGASFSPSREGEKFCCKGCEFVFELIHSEGLDRFYELRDKSAGQPVLDRPFQKNELGWLEAEQERAEEAAARESRAPRLSLHVRGISCVGCVWLIERLFRRIPGGEQADVFPGDGRLDLSWERGACDLPAFAAELQRFGYTVEPFQSSKTGRSELRSLATRLGLCGAFALNAMVFTLPRYLGMEDDFFLAGIFELITLLSATLAFLVGGTFFLVRAWASLRQRVLHIDLPIALGIVTAFAGSLAGWMLGAERLLYFDFVALFTFLMLGGRYLQVAAAERVRGNFQSQDPLPREITLSDGTVVPLEDLQPGTCYRVGSGAVVPVGSVMRDPSADFSLAWMTGEPTPVTVAAGRRIPAGAINLHNHAVEVRAEEDLSSSLVAAVTQQRTKSPRSPILEHVLKIYLAVVIVLALGGGAAWAILGNDIVTAIQVTLSILVVSCPCALGVALPLLDQRATASLRRRGVLIQTPTFWQRLAHVRSLLLDKTGTLTLERPQLTNPAELDRLSKTERQALATLASSSLHPLARSLFEALGGARSAGETGQFEEIPGVGVRTRLPSGHWSLGRPGWDGSTEGHPATSADAQMTSEFRRESKRVAAFHFEETARPGAARALSALRDSLGLKISILSGDQETRVKEQAASLGLNPADAHGGLSPTDKEDAVRRLSAEPTLYLGDGANDSLAFEAASVSGAPVTDRSVLDSKADFFFTAPGLGFLPVLFVTARWRLQRARRIVSFAIAYNLAAVTICLMGAMSPLLAAVLMPLSSLACLLIAAGPLPSCRAGAAGPEQQVPEHPEAPSGQSAAPGVGPAAPSLQP